jgi:hypothetical protein
VGYFCARKFSGVDWSHGAGRDADDRQPNRPGHPLRNPHISFGDD